MRETAPPPSLTPVKQALLKIDALRRELADARAAMHEPIAVVGIGCRLPGGADSPERLWDMLAAGTDAVTEVPPDRWTDAVHDPRPGRADTAYCRHGAFVDGVDRFDAAFFGVSGREARRIDPQQRLLLECTWRAIEDAGLTRERMQALKTGVFVGSSLDDYARLCELADDVEPSIAQTSLGTARPFAAGRISYLFGFHGPSVQLDTACSSSLVTAHLACQALRQRECDVALAGGANLMLSPEMTIGLCELQALSPDGRCKTFDAGADGYVRGEGAGMVALMRLSDARAQGRPIRAVIRGSAVNHDGKSNGMTAPNGRAQREVIREALARAGLAPAEVDYVEAHGTGTALGDPIELRALHDVYCRDAGRTQPLHVGSIKTNIGHLEAAASVAALVKVVCALQKGEIPKHLHFGTPTPHMDWSAGDLRVADRHMPWPAGRPGRRVAGISAFGMSGTNVHLLVESWNDDRAAAAASPVAAEPLPAAEPHIVPVSAHTPAMLARALAEAAAHVRQADVALDDFAHAMRHRRDTHRHRVAIVASGTRELAERLEDAARAAPRAGEPGGLAFLFPGQGAQYGGMARQLYRRHPVFREAIDECDRHFEALDPVSLVDVLWGDRQELLDDTRYTQPALFAVESALARLWSHWGLVPDVLLGHSIGEYAAACFAGVFSLEDGLKLVAARGRLMDALTPPGTMIAVLAPAGDVAPILADFAGRIELAGDNGPQSVTLAGEPQAMQSLVERLAREGIASRRLAVSRAFHSPLMEPMLERFRAVVASVRLQAPHLPVVSNVTGAAERERLCDPAYWVEHVRRTVRFRDGVATLLERGVQACLEVGPGKVLTGLARSCAGSGAGRLWLHSIEPGRDERGPMLASLAALFASGRPVDWRAFDAGSSRRASPRDVALPPYPLAPEAHWIGERRPADGARRLRAVSRAARPAEDGLLGREIRLPAARERRFESEVSLATVPVLGGHRVHGHLVFPAAGFVEMALDAAARCGGPGVPPGCEVEELAFDQPLLLDDARAVQLATVVDGARLDVYAGDDEGWTRHFGARIAPAPASPSSAALGDWQARCTEAIDADALYARLAQAGLGYGGAFRALRDVRRGDGCAVGRIALDAAPATGRVVHPALLDNAFQLVAAALWDAGDGTVHVPMALQRVRCRPLAETRSLWCAVELASRAPRVRADLRLFDDAGHCVAELAGLELAALDARRLAPDDRDLHVLEWTPWADDAQRAEPVAFTNTLVVGDGGALGEAIQARLRTARQPHVAIALPAAVALEDDRDALLRCVLEDFAQRPAPAGAPVLLVLWPPGPDAEAVHDAHRRFASLWRAVQATDWAGQAPMLAIVTRAAQRVPGDAVGPDPAQAAAWGLARSLVHEAGDLRVLAVDVAGEDDVAASTALRVLQAARHGDDSQFAVRGEAVHVPRLARRRAPRASASVAHGTHLVTGGRGAIGTRVVEWLLAKGAPKVVSASRRLPEDDERARLAALAERAGAQLAFVALDVTDGQAVHDLVAALDAEPDLPLKGVFHAAGTLEDGLLAMQPAAAARRVMAPKVDGALNLHRATAALALDHFVAFSSVVGCIGSPGQCAYGAANAYLDALVLQRNAQGLPGLAIDWGLWQGDGMAEQLDAQQLRRIEAFGLHPIDASSALRALDALASERRGQTLVWRVDVPTLMARSPALRPLLVAIGTPAAVPAAVPGTAGLGARLRALPPAEREAALARHLVEALAATLQVPADRVGVRQPLIELGLDSLMAAEFRSAIRTELDVDIPFGRLLEGATLDDIVRTVVERLGDGERAAPTATARVDARRLDAVSAEATFGLELESGQL